MSETLDVIDEAIREDAGVWFETEGKIWPKNRAEGLITPKQNYLQRQTQAVVNKMTEMGYPVRVQQLKPRQKGSTTYDSCLDYTHLRRKPASACVIGGQFSQTNEVWEMLQTYQANDQFDWGNTGEINAKEGRWSNGSRLKKETAGDALAGIAGTYQILHATEVARWSKYGVSNAGEVLANILKCVPLLPDTMVMLESTAEGASGTFYDRWLVAVDMDDFLSGRVILQPGQYVRVFAAWFQFSDSAMRLTAEQKLEVQKSIDADEEFDGEKRLLDTYGWDDNGTMRLGHSVPDYDAWEQLAWRRFAIRQECKRDKAIFDRDYPHSWQDAFMKSGNRRFNSTGLSVMRKRMAMIVPQHGMLEETRGRLNFRVTERNEAQVTIFEKPKIGRKYIMPIDPMTGASQVVGMDPDYHSVFILRGGFWDNLGKWVRPATAARIVPCRWDIDVVEGAAWKLARYYGSTYGCKIVIEMNQDRGITELLKLRGADLYQREQFNQREFKLEPALGYQTNVKTRENLVETMASAIREYNSNDNGIDIYCEHALEQCDNFVVNQRGHSCAAEGFHDDDVIGIGLGLHLIEHATTYWPVRMNENLPPDLRSQQQQNRQGLGGPCS